MINISLNLLTGAAARTTQLPQAEILSGVTGSHLVMQVGPTQYSVSFNEIVAAILAAEKLRNSVLEQA